VDLLGELYFYLLKAAVLPVIFILKYHCGAVHNLKCLWACNNCKSLFW